MGEDYTGAPAQVFEQVLTSTDNWISYSDMVASEDDIRSMAEKLVAMSLWPKVPDNLQEHYFDMRFAIHAENSMRAR